MRNNYDLIVLIQYFIEPSFCLSFCLTIFYLKCDINLISPSCSTVIIHNCLLHHSSRPQSRIMSHLLQPTVVLLKDGSEQAQGKSHVIHNVNACQAVSEIVRTTLGPRGMDKLIYNNSGNVTISNDGRTIIDLLDIVHPAAKTLVDIAIAQDNEVGDGTTSVVVLAAEFLKQAKQFIEDGVHPQTIIRAYRDAQQLVCY